MKMNDNLKKVFKILGILFLVCVCFCILGFILPTPIFIIIFIISPFMYGYIMTKYENFKFKNKLSKKWDISGAKESIITNDKTSQFYDLYNPKIKIIEDSVVQQIKSKDKEFSKSTFKQKSVAYFKKLQMLKDTYKDNIKLNNDIKDLFVVAAFIIKYEEDNNYEYIGVRLTAKNKLKDQNVKNSFNNYYIEFKKNKTIQKNEKIIDVECRFCGAPIDITKNNECPYCRNIILIDKWLFNKIDYWEGEL